MEHEKAISEPHTWTFCNVGLLLENLDKKKGSRKVNTIANIDKWCANIQTRPPNNTFSCGIDVTFFRRNLLKD